MFYQMDPIESSRSAINYGPTIIFILIDYNLLFVVVFIILIIEIILLKNIYNILLLLKEESGDVLVSSMPVR